MRYREAMLMGLALLCLAVIGCVSPRAYYCDDGCAPQAISGRYAADCGATPCTSCEGTVVDPFCGHTLTGLLRAMVTCNAGCGDIYWGEWSHDPPDVCDPCNNHGDWTGPGCCPPSGWRRFWDGLHGARCGGVRSCDTLCEPTCGGWEADCGCDDCGARGDAIYGARPYESLDEQYEFPAAQEPLEPVPTPQPQPQAGRRARRGASAYYSANRQPVDHSESVTSDQPERANGTRGAARNWVEAQPRYGRNPNSRLIRRSTQ